AFQCHFEGVFAGVDDFPRRLDAEKMPLRWPVGGPWLYRDIFGADDRIEAPDGRQSDLRTLDPKQRSLARDGGRFLHQLSGHFNAIERGIQHDTLGNADVDSAQSHRVAGAQTMSFDKLDGHPWSGRMPGARD